jgi:hypothetical protein
MSIPNVHDLCMIMVVFTMALNRRGRRRPAGGTARTSAEELAAAAGPGRAVDYV